MTVSTTVLDNGLTVATDSMPGTETVAMGVWIDAGARHESAETNGVAHLLEHMMFKGTRRRSAADIASEIEDVGGYLNAYTSREQTAYHARVLEADVALAVDLISDMIVESTLDRDELERERTVILQEIGMVHDTPDELVFDHLQEAAYPDQPLGRPVLGTAEGIRGMQRDLVAGYLDHFYRGDRMVVAASGAIAHAAFVDLVAGALGSRPAAAGDVIEPARFVGGERRDERDSEQAHLVVGLPGLPLTDPDYHALSVFSTLLGGGMSSRLFQEVREKRGLVYSIYSFVNGYRDGGLFGIYAGTGPDDIAELVPVMCDELAGAADTADEVELERAKAQLRASYLMARESTNARCDQLAHQILYYGGPLTREDVLERIERVDLAAIRRVAARLRVGPLAVGAVGPLDGLEPADRIAARLA